MQTGEIHRIVRQMMFLEAPFFSDPSFALGPPEAPEQPLEVIIAIGPNKHFEKLKEAEQLDRPTLFLQLPLGWPFADLTVKKIGELVAPREFQRVLHHENFLVYKVK